MENMTDAHAGICKLPKIKTHFARIIVGGTADKPYYDILYYDPTDKEYHIGFGSYCLENVFNWLEEEFEIVGGNEKSHQFERVLSMADISTINRALGLIEGLSWAVQDSGIADGLVSAVERIEAVIDKEEDDENH